MQIIARENAIKLNLKRFFTGIACNQGHISERYTGRGNCCECMKVYAEKHYIKNHIRLKKYAKKVFQSLSDEEKKRRIITKNKWYWENRDKALSYRKSLSARYAAYARNRRSKITNAGGVHNINDVNKIFALQHGKCCNCYCKVNEKYHVDHIMPIALGGTSDKHNLQILCPPCNRSKGKKHPLKWAKDNGRLL